MVSSNILIKYQGKQKMDIEIINQISKKLDSFFLARAAEKKGGDVCRTLRDSI